jgi:hypothetical protein
MLMAAPDQRKLFEVIMAPRKVTPPGRDAAQVKGIWIHENLKPQMASGPNAKA